MPIRYQFLKYTYVSILIVVNMSLSSKIFWSLGWHRGRVGREEAPNYTGQQWYLIYNQIDNLGAKKGRENIIFPVIHSWERKAHQTSYKHYIWQSFNSWCDILNVHCLEVLFIFGYPHDIPTWPIHMTIQLGCFIISFSKWSTWTR